MTKVFLALGSNICDKREHINETVRLLKEQIKKVKVAKFYETKPQYFEDQDIFINTVLRGYTNLKITELFKYIKDIEKQIGRKERFKYGPREIDIDILFYDDLIYEDKNLIIPHPLMQERGFVLKPFLDLEPDFVHPVLRKTMRELHREL